MKLSLMGEGIEIRRQWLTADIETQDLLFRNDLTIDSMWEQIIAGDTSLDNQGRERFAFFGRMFLVTENVYGGPHIKML